MTWEDFGSIKKIVLGALLVYMLWLLAGNVFGFAKMMQRQQHEQQQTLQQVRDSGAEQANLLRQNTEALARHNREQQDFARQKIERLQSGATGSELKAPALADHLRKLNAFGTLADPRRQLRCETTEADWNYICRFHPDPIGTPAWVQFGVLVDRERVIEMSKAFPLGTRLPAPLTQSVTPLTKR